MAYPEAMAYMSQAPATSAPNPHGSQAYPSAGPHSLEQLEGYHQQMLSQQPYQAGLTSQKNYPQQSPHAQQQYQTPQYYDHPLTQHALVVNEPVIIREDNYPASLSMLTQIQNTMAAMQAQLAEANRAAEEAKAAAQLAQDAQVAMQSAGRKQELKASAKETRMTRLIQDKMRWSVGIGGHGIDGKKVKVLPHPLGPGQEAEMLEDGLTKKTHPNWLQGVSDPVNALFCERSSELCMEHVIKDNSNGGALYGDPSSAAVLKKAKRFYDSLRKTYAAQTTEEGARRRRKKQTLNKRRSRKGEKADNHREAIPKFREIHGEENTVGDYDAIQTDDMSSEHSDCGKVARHVFQAHRKKAGGGDNGWEVRKKHWHSSWVRQFPCERSTDSLICCKARLYYAHLKTIRRDMLADAQEEGANGSLGGKHRVPRFKGLRENENDKVPILVRKKPLYESMVSASWLEETGRTYKEVGAVTDPAHFTLFTLKLDTTGLNEAELEYLADDET